MPILPSGLEITLNNTEHPHAMGESHHGHIPYWKRAHHDWRFWIGLVLMLTAIAVYQAAEKEFCGGLTPACRWLLGRIVIEFPALKVADGVAAQFKHTAAAACRA